MVPVGVVHNVYALVGLWVVKWGGCLCLILGCPWGLLQVNFYLESYIGEV